MTHPAIKFATKFKTSPANYWVAKDLYSGAVKRNHSITIKDIHHLLVFKGVKIGYSTLCRLLKDKGQ